MQVTNGDALFKVRWAYENPELLALLKEKGLSFEEANEMKKVDLIEQLGIKSLPKPLTTVCIIVDNENTEIMVAKVTRHYLDTYDKDKGRKLSLKKALTKLFPEYQEKAERRLFWIAYLDRKMSKEEKTFFRLLSKYQELIPAIV